MEPAGTDPVEAEDEGAGPADEDIAAAELAAMMGEVAAGVATWAAMLEEAAETEAMVVKNSAAEDGDGAGGEGAEIAAAAEEGTTAAADDIALVIATAVEVGMTAAEVAGGSSS